MSDLHNSIAPVLIKHPDYFLDMIIFRVEGCLFKVPKCHFVRSIDILPVSLNQPQVWDAEGYNEESPINLQGVTKVDFENLMKVMYPLKIACTQTLSYDEWVSVLDLSTKWYLVEFRRLAIAKLTTVCNDFVAKILLGKKYRVSEWLINGYEQLAKRTEKISDDEVKIIGRLTTIFIYGVREEAYSHGMGGNSFSYRGSIREICAKELADVEADERGYGTWEQQ